MRWRTKSLPWPTTTQMRSGLRLCAVLITRANMLRTGHFVLRKQDPDEFNFFVPLLETLNRKDEQAVFFLEIKDAKGVFPMLGVENKLDGAEVSKLEVTKVIKVAQKPTIFEIPAGFNKFERN